MPFLIEHEQTIFLDKSFLYCLVQYDLDPQFSQNYFSSEVFSKTYTILILIVLVFPCLKNLTQFFSSISNVVLIFH